MADVVAWAMRHPCELYQADGSWFCACGIWLTDTKSTSTAWVMYMTHRKERGYAE